MHIQILNYGIISGKSENQAFYKLLMNIILSQQWYYSGLHDMGWIQRIVTLIC